MKSVWSDETDRRIKQVDKIRCCVLLTSCSFKIKKKIVAPLFHALQDQDMILSRHCIHSLKSIPDIDRYLSMTQGCSCE